GHASTGAALTARGLRALAALLVERAVALARRVAIGDLVTGRATDGARGLGLLLGLRREQRAGVAHRQLARHVGRILVDAALAIRLGLVLRRLLARPVLGRQLLGLGLGDHRLVARAARH